MWWDGYLICNILLMTKFQEIIKHHKDNVYGWWHTAIPTNWRTEIYLYFHDTFSHTKTISINDLLSPNSWFMQAVKWKPNWDYLALNPYVTNLYNDWSMVEQDKSFYWWEYHSMRLSILPDEEKIKYLEDNVLID